MKTCQEMMQGTAAPLVSTFRLSYYSLLNLMSRAEGQFNSEHVIRHSFHQFQHDKVIISFDSFVRVVIGPVLMLHLSFQNTSSVGIPWSCSMLCPRVTYSLKISVVSGIAKG